MLDRRHLLLLTILSNSSCQKQVDDTDYDDIAASLGAMVAPSTESGETALAADISELGLGSGELVATSSGSYAGTRGGLTYSYAVRCFGPAGQEQASCGPLSRRVEADVNWSGNLAVGGFTAQLARSGHWSADIQTSAIVMTGSGHFDMASSVVRAGSSSSLTLNYDATYSDVTYSTEADRLTSGSIHYEVMMSRSRTGRLTSADAEVVVDAVVTFHADGAQLTLDGNRSYSIRMSDGSVTRVLAE